MKIISLFQRNYEGDRLVRDEVVNGAEWVVSGEGVATRKWDGTACMVRAGKLYKRYDVKGGRKAPPNFEAASDPDPVTGHWPGWIPVGDGPDDQWHREAFFGGGFADGDQDRPSLSDGTYELCGPKINGNPEGYLAHALIPHGKHVIEPCPRDFEGVRDFLRATNIEGIVWHHADGRMGKIKARDFNAGLRCRALA